MDRLKYALHATEQPPEEPRAQHEDRPPSKRPRRGRSAAGRSRDPEDMGDLADMVRQKAAREPGGREPASSRRGTHCITRSTSTGASPSKRSALP